VARISGSIRSLTRCGGVAGVLGDSGAAPALDLWAVVLRLRAPPPLPRTRRRYRPQRFPQRRTITNRRAVLLAPGILSPRKDHSRGRSLRSRRCRDGASATLECDLPLQDPVPIGEDGEKRSGHLLPRRRHLTCSIFS
jgi:hypothetical protein